MVTQARTAVFAQRNQRSWRRKLKPYHRVGDNCRRWLFRFIGSVAIAAAYAPAALAQCVPDSTGGALIEFRRVHAVDPPDPSVAGHYRGTLAISAEPFLTDRDLSLVGTMVEQGRLALMLEVSSASIERFEAAHAALVGHSYLVTIQSEPLAVFPVHGHQPLRDRRFFLFLEMPTANAERAADAIERRWCGRNAGFEDYVRQPADSSGAYLP
jgi:hypothetical protein